MKRKFILFLLPFLVSGVMAQDPVQVKYAQEISNETAYKHLSVLTSDEFAGRRSGEIGAQKSVEYLAAEFEKYGLKGAYNGTYFQPVPLAFTSFDVKNFKVNGKTVENGKDFMMSGSGGETKINVKDIVFVGYGISDAKYDDFAGVDVKDKVVLLINEGEPLDAQGNSLITGTKDLSDWTTARNKRMQNVVSKGPRLILTTSSAVARTLERFAGRMSAPRIAMTENVMNQDGPSAPAVANITEAMADQLLSSSKNTLAGLKKSIQDSGKPQSKKLKATVSATYGAVIEPFDDYNVVGMIEGRENKDEIVVVMAHYDHDGINANGEVLRGADDNGSGTVGVLEIARAFSEAAKAGHGPRRTILFIGLAAEERGLIGSDYYTRHPIFPLEKTVACLNMDMIGRIDDVHINGNHNYIHVIGADKLSSELHEINFNANATYTHMELDTTYNDPKDPNRFYFRSDHYHFAKMGVPSIFYFNGTHPDYHTPRDVIEKIDFDMLVKRARLVFHTAWELANREKAIVRDSNKP